MNAGFSLVDEPWIEVRTLAGGSRMLSLREVLHDAHELKEIVGDLPTQAFALTRLVLAVLHRVVDGPADADAWEDLAELDRAPAGQVDDYLDRMQDRFDLFSPTRPFFQVAGLRTAKGTISGLEKLIADVPAGHPYFTTRAGRGLERITPAEAARWLVHLQAYDVSGIKSGAVGDDRVKGGRGYPIGTGWAGQLGGLLMERVDPDPARENLWQTLLLNLVPRQLDAETLASFHDRPTWEADPAPTAAQDPAVDRGTDGRPYGPLDLYTWQSRRVLLHGDRDGVTGVLVANGDRLTPQNRHHREPMSSWRRSEAQEKKKDAVAATVYMPQTLRPDRALWRGLNALLPAVAPRSGAKSGAPWVTATNLQWAGSVAGRGARVRVRAVGVDYGTQSATYADVVSDALILPRALLVPSGAALAAVAEGAARSTEAGVVQLRILAANLVQAAGATEATMIDGARNAASTRAYSLIDAPYRAWLAGLTEGTDPDRARADWHRTARDIIRAVGLERVEAAGPKAWVGREVNKRRVTSPEAQAWFERALWKALPDLDLTGSDPEPSDPDESTEGAADD